MAYKAERDAELALLLHPAQSPDLNPIEPIWQIIKQRLRGKTWTTGSRF
jgi:DDE superfamily endonuclease